MSLPQLVLSPAQPFSLEDGQVLVGGVSDGANTNIFALMIRGFLGGIGALFIIYIIYSLFSKEGRQRLLVNIVIVAILFFFASKIQQVVPQEEAAQPVMEQPFDIQENLPTIDAPVAIFSEEPPTWITPTIIILVSALTVGVLYWISRIFMRREPTVSPLEEFAQEAQQAIESLNTGQDFKLTVINCYQEMNRIVKEQKGIERNSTMTVREFEEYLIGAGLPETAIKMLSRLFEQVRYGSAMEQSGDEELALACLTDIVDACRNIGVHNGI